MSQTLLIVDDEPDLREILAEELQASGFTIVQAENGAAALLLLQRQSVDLILTDIRMPGPVSGLNLLEFVRSQPNPPGVLLMSGFADMSLAEALQKGAKGLISKPFQLQDILESVRNALS